jgi:hypothetical protein
LEVHGNLFVSGGIIYETSEKVSSFAALSPVASLGLALDHPSRRVKITLVDNLGKVSLDDLSIYLELAEDGPIPQGT